MEIDIATIEKGSDYLGMVASIPPEDQFTRWRSEYESDILVSLASLAGERMFFDGDSSSGVSGDLESATAVASFMEGYWGMGHTVSSYSTARRLEVGSPGGGRGGPQKGDSTEKVLRAALADRIEDQLADLLTKAEEILRENRLGVLALAHALETHKTLTGEDVEAVLEQRIGISVDGTVYGDAGFIEKLEEYHSAAAGAHVGHSKIDGSMPEGGRLAPPPPAPEPEPVAAGPYAGYGYGQPQGYGVPAPGNGQAQPGPWQGAPGYGYPPPGPAGNGGGGNGAGNGAPGYPPPPPVQGWGRPEPGSDTPTQGYGPGQAAPEPGSDTPTQGYGPGQAAPEPGSDTPTQGYGTGQTGHAGNGNGHAAPDNGQTTPAAWYQTEPLHQQPETGPVHIVGEPSADTPPAGEKQVGDAPEGRESPEASPNGQAERRTEAESNEDEDRPDRA
jgi:Peptidase family M41